jgi:hypothetical protein
MKDKSVEVNGVVLYYDSGWSGDDYGEWYETWFYEETEIVKRKKGHWFKKSEYYDVEVPKILFTIYEDINNIRLSKNWWRNEIEKELSLINRKDEIEQGKLI